MSYTALTMSKKNVMATIVDSHNVNRVLKKVEKKESGISYSYVGKKEYLRIVGIGDTLFITDEKSFCIIILLLTNKGITRASPIH